MFFCEIIVIFYQRWSTCKSFNNLGMKSRRSLKVFDRLSDNLTIYFTYDRWDALTRRNAISRKRGRLKSRLKRRSPSVVTKSCDSKLTDASL